MIIFSAPSIYGMVLRLISPIAFVVSLIVGLLFGYMANPAPDVVRVYPTPENVSQLQYRDRAGVCFEYSADKVKCPANGTALTIPVQN